jgi:eukaryotic-like serine/threonine-protein kinase
MNDGSGSHTELDAPSGSGSGDALDDPRVAEVVQAYLTELEQGARPDREGYLRRFPELEGAIAQCLDGLDLVRATAPRPSVAGQRRGAWEQPSEFTPRELGDFQILRELGRGGMGVVYEAVQLSLGRRVALKVLPFAATFDSRQLQRFKNEAQAAALLHHTNIVPVYAVGSERGVHFYAMQLIEGQSLAVLLRQLRKQAGVGRPTGEGRSAAGASALSLSDLDATDLYLGGEMPAGALVASSRVVNIADASRSTASASLSITAKASRGGDSYFHKVARLVSQAAEALDHAHQVGIVHRDIKPANLLVNATGTLWIADFGLAQFQTDTGLTRTGDMLGTFRYMSPEMAAGHKTAVDHRTDIYSLGATLYEMLTLEPVFDGETRQELLYQILHGEPRAPRTIDRSVPVELETIALKALRKTPADRYATAGEFADDIRRFLDNRPILARPPSLIDRLRKWSRRHPSAVAAAAVLVVFGIVGLSVSNWLIAREQLKTAAALEGERRQQIKTAKALEGERLRANEAEELFRQARQAVDVLVEISEEDLAGPFMEQTRKRMLQTALNLYQDFIEERHGDEVSRADLARVEQRVKGILRDLNLLQRDIQTQLLRDEIVIEDLRLNAEQRQELSALHGKWEAERTALSREFKQKKVDEEVRHRRLVELAEQHERALDDVLTDPQVRRLRQIGIQSQNLFAFKDPDIAAELALTPAQRTAVRKIEREAFEAVWHRRDRGAPHDGDGKGPPEERGGDRHGRGGDRKRPDDNAKGRDKRGPSEEGGPSTWPEIRQAVPKVVALLTEDQARRWHELIGPPVKGLIASQPPPGRPAGGK